MKYAGHCATIPAGYAFLNSLARWILERFGADSAALPKLLVLLPTRRACRGLRQAFLEETGGKPILLPRIQPLGDLGEEDALFAYHSEAPPPLPAISTLRRELLLTRLVMAAGRKQHSAPQAARLARQLAEFIDEAARCGLGFDRLGALVPQELAAHWQETLDFLTLVSRHWPEILQGEGALDPAQHRNLQLEALARQWRKTPPSYPVIAAGSTGSIPATAELLKIIAQLPQGWVVLPALDMQMPQAEWDWVAETHPQYGLKKLLEAMECSRGDMSALSLRERGGASRGEGGLIKDPHPSPLPEGEGISRLACLRAWFQPPEATPRWAQAALPLAEGLRHVRLLTADTLLDEARLIAILLREALETPGKTAALVTPDRQLARLVASQMQRFGIAIDDSAGRPLADTPAACFLRLVVEVAASGAAPVPLLALLRHPLAAAGMDTAQCRRLSRLLETALLRGVRHAPGLAILHSAAKDHPALQRLLRAVAEAMQPLMDCFAQPSLSLQAWLQAHLQCAEALAATEKESGAQRLWAGEAGNALAAFLAELAQHAGILEAVDPHSYSDLFDALLSGQVHRPRFGLHPRLHILSPMEARLQHFDLVILGSLNEGSWPQGAQADPWMSRPMRAGFGLPPLERGIGQSAHDVSQLCAMPEVVLSRARKVEGQPTVVSRWLVRLATLVEGLDPAFYRSMQIDQHYEQAMRWLDAPLPLPLLTKPQPRPPLEARPRRLRVTAIDAWLRDPYIIYARHILKLRKLEPLDQEPDAADFGNLVHKALEQFIHAYPADLPPQPLSALLECGQRVFAEWIERPAVACLWWPRFAAMAAWVIEREQERRGSLRQVGAELQGEWVFELEGRPFTLTTRIDRAEIGRDGAITIIDYKTGMVPSKSEIEQGLANQLPLEALMARQDALSLPEASHIAMEYWKLSGNTEACCIQPVGAEHIEYAQQRLEALIRQFDDPATPYAAQSDPSLLMRYNDYEHLARKQEWEAV